ncbi:hypothetical protein CK203_058966 [Vitis vinifera]|uniref:Reverse transcriptase Ty1/copia-type domain-containing protein n=1 Tax=Vitis vinifera TaxID=29760 RepID=A0A438FTC7_VITVI|nr:hypothetical protein CK203_058966 [Vitis vinifera]
MELTTMKHFPSVAKLNAIRVLLSLAGDLDWPLQLDVKNVFLNGNQKEDVYMEIPPDFETQVTINKVWDYEEEISKLKGFLAKEFPIKT